MSKRTNIFFSSDHHFSHANCVQFDKRPFKDIEEMEEDKNETHKRLEEIYEEISKREYVLNLIKNGGSLV